MPAFPDISELIPHRGPAILLTRVLSHRLEETRCEARVGPAMQYVNEGTVDAALGLELLAQTAAAHTGLVARHRGAAPRPGYVVAVPQMKFFGGDYVVGDELLVVVRALSNDGRWGRVEGEVLCRGQLRAQGSLTIFVPPLAEGASAEDEYKA